MVFTKEVPRKAPLKLLLIKAPLGSVPRKALRKAPLGFVPREV